MFYNQVRDLLLGSDIADCLFPNITGTANGDDCSFIATLRGLLSNRIGEDTLNLSAKRFHCNGYFLDQTEAQIIVQDAIDGSSSNGCIKVICLRGDSDAREYVFSTIKENFSHMYPEYSEVESIEIYLRKIEPALVYLSEDRKSSIVVAKNLSSEFYHLLQSTIPKLLPWYFEGDNRITAEEIELLRCMSRSDGMEDYIRRIQEIAAKFDFREAKIKKILDGFEERSLEEKVNQIGDQISGVENDIRLNLQRYSSLVAERETLFTQKYGLQQRIKDATNNPELMTYFLTNKHLDPCFCSESTLGFIVSGYLDNFDPDVYESYTQNLRSYIYTAEDSYTDEIFMSDEVRRKFLDAIFGDAPTLKIKMCAYYEIDLAGSVDSVSDYNYPVEYDDYLRNPHLNIHNCFGDYRRYILEYLRSGDLILAIEQCIASAKSVNIGEAATFPYFLIKLFHRECGRVIELPDGTSVTPKDAYQWLLSQEEKVEEIQETANEEEERTENGETN